MMYGPMDQRLCLRDKEAQPYMKMPVGTKVVFTVEATLVEHGLDVDYDVVGRPGGSKDKADQPTPNVPRAEFQVTSIAPEEEETPDYKNMTSKEFEKRVAKKRGY